VKGFTLILLEKDSHSSHVMTQKEKENHFSALLGKFFSKKKGKFATEYLFSENCATFEKKNSPQKTQQHWLESAQ